MFFNVVDSTYTISNRICDVDAVLEIVDVCQEDDEFISAQSSDQAGILARIRILDVAGIGDVLRVERMHGTQSDLPEQFIANVMTKGVIDEFKVVEIKQDKSIKCLLDCL